MSGPDRIYASKSTRGQCVVSFATPSEEYCIPYTRADLIPDPAAIARAALEKAAEILHAELSKNQADLSRLARALAENKKPSVAYKIQRTRVDTLMSERDKIRALANDLAALAEIVKGSQK